MKPYKKPKRIKGEYGMINVIPYTCGNEDVEKLRAKGISLFLTRDLICACDKYLCPVIQNAKIGFINSYAEIVIFPKYDTFIGEFTSPESIIAVSKDKKWGLLNADGLEMLMGEFNSITPIDNQYAIVMNSEYKKGIIEIMTKKMTIPFGEYDNFDYYKSVLEGRKKLLKGLITPTGKQLTPIQYRWISGIEYGLFRVIIEEKVDDVIVKKWGG